MRLGGCPLIARVASTGDWAKNTGLKPAAIQSLWDQVEHDWFLYTDIDASILSIPQIAENRWDIGAVDNPDPGHVNRLAAAAIFFHKTSAGRLFLKRWTERCAHYPGKDHGQLTNTIRNAQASRYAAVVSATSWLRWQQNGLSNTKPAFDGL